MLPRNNGEPMAKLRNTSPAFLGLFALLLVVGWTILAFTAIHGTLPYNPLRAPLAQSIKVSIWAPEGWAFFTRSPQVMRTSVFEEENGKWVSASLGPQARPSNFFGMNRTSRAQGVELGLLTADLQPGNWRSCDQDPIVCLAGAPIVGTFKNRSPHPTYCGKVGIVRQRPVPWAWQQSADKIIMPSHVVVLREEC